MCGIFAILGLTAVAPHTYRQRAVELSKRIRHRGPDAEHCHTDDAGNYLCHQRLAIMDPNAASEQPLFLNKGTPDELCWITNGEIYNHLALKEELGLDASLSDSWVPARIPPDGGVVNSAIGPYARARGPCRRRRARVHVVCAGRQARCGHHHGSEAPHGPSIPNESSRVDGGCRCVARCTPSMAREWRCSRRWTACSRWWCVRRPTVSSDRSVLVVGCVSRRCGCDSQRRGG